MLELIIVIGRAEYEQMNQMLNVRNKPLPASAALAADVIQDKEWSLKVSFSRAMLDQCYVQHTGWACSGAAQWLVYQLVLFNPTAWL